MDRTLSGATTPGQSGPGSDGNEGVLSSSQSSNITGASPSDCLVSYRKWETIQLIAFNPVTQRVIASQLSNLFDHK